MVSGAHRRIGVERSRSSALGLLDCTARRDTVGMCAALFGENDLVALSMAGAERSSAGLYTPDRVQPPLRAGELINAGLTAMALARRTNQQ
jgi:hypothetical protein